LSRNMGTANRLEEDYLKACVQAS